MERCERCERERHTKKQSVFLNLRPPPSPPSLAPFHTQPWTGAAPAWPKLPSQDDLAAVWAAAVGQVAMEPLAVAAAAAPPVSTTPGPTTPSRAT